MRRRLAFAAACAVALSGLVACSDDEQPIADVCAVADLELVSQWQGGAHELVDSQTNDCSYRSVEFATLVHITARRSGGQPSVRVQVQYDDPTPEYDDELFAAYLAEAAYGIQRSGPSIAERAAALSALPDGEYPCSGNFVAGADTAIVSIYVDDRDGDPMAGALSAVFGSALLSTQCSDEGEENPVRAVVDERWPATSEDIRMDLPPGLQCGPATVHLVGVTAFPPDGTIVELGDLTMTNTNWMIEPPFECRRT